MIDEEILEKVDGDIKMANFISTLWSAYTSDTGHIPDSEALVNSFGGLRNSLVDISTVKLFCMSSPLSTAIVGRGFILLYS